MAIDRVNLEDVISDAKAALEAGNPDRAIALCHHIFNFYPRCLEAARMLGEAYTEQRLFTEAEQLFIFVLLADPQDVLGYVDRGFIAYEQRQLDDAILYCEHALELDPSIEQLREELLRLYRERQPNARAQVRISKVGLANARLRDGLYGQAIEEYNTVLLQTPNRLDVQVGLMEAYWRNRDYTRAEQLAVQLIENNSFLVKANLVLWHIYGVRRNQEHASDYLERAHALDPLNLLAERLFEDTAASGDALNYISMLGVPSIPAPDLEALNAQVANQKSLVPEWATGTGGQETDVVLGLKDNLPSIRQTAPAPSPGANMGLDLFVLLSDTEKHVAESSDQDDGLYPDTEEDETAGKPAQTASGEGQDALNLYEEVPATHEAAVASPGPAQTAPGAFDLDFSVAKEGDLSLFEEIEQRLSTEPGQENPESSTSEDSRDASSNAAPAFPGGSVSPDLTPFTFDEDVSSPGFTRDSLSLFDDNESAQAAPTSGNRAPANSEDFVLPTLEPFTFDETVEPDEPESSAASPGLDTKPAYQFQDLYATDDAANEATQQFDLKVSRPTSGTGSDDITPQNAFSETFEPGEGPGLPLEPEPRPTPIPTPSITPETAGEPPAHPGNSDQPAVEPPGLPETAPGAEPDQPLPMFESEAATVVEPPGALVKMDNHEPAETNAASPETGAAYREPYAFYKRDEQGPIQVNHDPYAFYKRDEQGEIPDFALEQMAQESSLPAFGGLDDLDTDTETETETATATPAAGPVSVASPPPDTLQENPPMPIRRGQENLNDLFDWEREELPDYLQPFALDDAEIAPSDLEPESPFIADINTPPARIRSREDTGPTNMDDLPSWLMSDTTPTPASPENSANPPAFDDSDFGDLAPFSLEETSDFNAPNQPGQPSAQPATPNGFNTAAYGQASDLEPFRLDDDAGDFGQTATPVPPQPLPDVSADARRQPGEAGPPPAPAPAFDLGLDLDDLKPFSFEEFDAAVPASGGGTPPAQAAPEPDSRPFADQFRQTGPVTAPPAGSVEPGIEEIQPFNLADFDDLSVTPSSPPAPPPAPVQGVQPDFDFEPFSWNEGDKLFGEADAANFNPFESLSQADYTQSTPPPQVAPQPPAPDQPLRQFEWSRSRAVEPTSPPANPGQSLFEKLVARRKETEALTTGPLASASPQPSAQPGSQKPETEAAEEQLDEAVDSGKIPAEIEPDDPDALPQTAYTEAPDVQPVPDEPQPVQTPAQTAPFQAVLPPSQSAPVQAIQETTAPGAVSIGGSTQENLRKAYDLYAHQDYNQSLNLFNQAVKTAEKGDLPEIITKLKELTGSADANPRFHRVLGDAYKKQGQFQAALAEYSKALAGNNAKK